MKTLQRTTIRKLTDRQLRRRKARVSVHGIVRAVGINLNNYVAWENRLIELPESRVSKIDAVLRRLEGVD